MTRFPRARLSPVLATFVALSLLFLTACPPGVDTTPGVNAVLVTSVAISNDADTYAITSPGGTLQLKATVSPADASDATVTWSVSAGASFATVSATGLVAAVANGTATIKATANDASGISATKDITISGQALVATPTASIASGAVVIGQLVTLSTTTSGATIRYTLDGTEPSTASSEYAVASPIEVMQESVTLKAKAYKDGAGASATSTYDYSLKDGFTIVSDGARSYFAEGLAGTVVSPMDMRAYGPLFEEAGDRDVTVIACKDSLLFGTEANPYLMFTITYDYSATYSTYQSLVQVGVPFSELTTLPKTFTVGTDSLNTSVAVHGNPIPSDQIADGSTFTVTSLGAVGEPIIGEFSINSDDGSSVDFAISGKFRALRGGDVPMTLGSALSPQLLCAGVSMGSNAVNGSTSYYRIPVSDCDYSVFVMAFGGMGGGAADTSVTINNSESYNIDFNSDGTNETWATSIHETDGYYDLTVKDDSTADVAGAAYTIILMEAYSDTAQFLARYDENANGDYDDVAPGALAVIGDGSLGTYTISDLNSMLASLKDYVPSAQGLASGDEILYGKAEATGEYIFAVHRASSGDSWSVSTITEGAYNLISERDPYSIP